MRWRLPILLLISCTSDPIDLLPVGGPDNSDTIDEDNDGEPVATDCDDANPAINHSAEERCDGVDNDCNGAIDTVALCHRQSEFVQGMKLDLLLVIDNSCSMLDAQIAVSESIDSLLMPLIGPDLDTHIGAISTDVDDDTSAGLLQEIHGRSFADETLDPIDAHDWAQAAVVMGIAGSATERGLDAVLASLQKNNGFRRQDAHFVVVIVSDEDDQSVIRPADFLVDLTNETQATGTTVHALVSTTDDCPEVTGNTYLSISALTGGFHGSICDPDYSQLLSAIGQYSAQRGLLRKHDLGEPARADSVRIRIRLPGGLTQPTIDWSLADDGNSLVLLNPPPPGSIIYVDWDLRVD